MGFIIRTRDAACECDVLLLHISDDDQVSYWLVQRTIGRPVADGHGKPSRDFASCKAVDFFFFFENVKKRVAKLVFKRYNGGVETSLLPTMKRLLGDLQQREKRLRPTHK